VRGPAAMRLHLSPEAAWLRCSPLFTAVRPRSCILAVPGRPTGSFPLAARGAYHGSDLASGRPPAVSKVSTANMTGNGVGQQTPLGDS
jgi:hypothetical protein